MDVKSSFSPNRFSTFSIMQKNLQGNHSLYHPLGLLDMAYFIFGIFPNICTSPHGNSTVISAICILLTTRACCLK